MSVVLDRRGTLATISVASGVAMFFAVLFAGSTLYSEAPALGYAGLIAGVGGTLAAARGYWASSTRKVRERISGVMDAIGQAVAEPGTKASGFSEIGEGAAAPKPDPSLRGGTEPTGR